MLVLVETHVQRDGIHMELKVLLCFHVFFLWMYVTVSDEDALN